MGTLLTNIGTALDEILSSEHIGEATEVEMLGGALRAPRVKQFILDKVNSVKPGMNAGVHMNQDEAMAMGSGYIAANFSSSYKVQKVFMYQQVTETIYLNITEKGCDPHIDE